MKIIETAGVLAGPAVGMFFAEGGAQVIKIENLLTNGDITRQWKFEGEHTGHNLSAYFASANYSKQYIFLDLTIQHDRNIFYDHIKTADVLICNTKKNDNVKLGTDYETIKKINPHIIYACITGYGDDSSRVAYDVVLQAETGWMYLNKDSNNNAVKIPVAIVDLFAAHHLKEGILTAYIQKLKTGKGCKVTVSLFDAAVSALANQASNYLMADKAPPHTGALHPNIAPYGEVITFKNGEQMVLAIGSDRQFIQLCEVLNLDELILDNNFSTNALRVKNRQKLFNQLHSKALTLDSKQIIQACIEKNIPAGSICNLEQLFEQQAAKDLIIEDEIGRRVKTLLFHIQH